MTSVVTFSTVVFVVATYVRAQRAPLPHQSNFIPKAVAHRGHDQKELGGRGDADARRHQLRAEPTAAWRVWARHGHAAHSDKEALRVRTRLLQDKLRLAAKRVKREVKVPGQKPEYVWVAPRAKKGAEDKWEPDRKGPPSMELHFYNPDIFFPENIAALENETGPYQEILRKERKKRPKREAAVFWAGERTGRALELQRVKRTTANPFIPDTNIEDYQIGSADTAEQYVPDTGSAPALTDSFVMRMPKAISRFFEFVKIKIGQVYSARFAPSAKPNQVQEESHVRVKRRMSRFVRDKKQMTRKKKIGRRKKTKVRRAPVKLLKWYDKHFKKKKKGDGTYRGGRGRIPRQHKRPRNYKPPQNETSNYDYYDDDGNVKVGSGETQEGSDDAAYVSYVSGEYKDTAEAEAANQQMEKEYQEQLVRERKREERRRLSNGTWESSEESWSRYLYVPEEKTNSTKAEDGEEGDGNKEEGSGKSKGSSNESGDSSGDDNNRKRKSKKNRGPKRETKKSKTGEKKSPKKKSDKKLSSKTGANPKISQNHLGASNNHQNMEDPASINPRTIAKRLKASSLSAFPGIRGSLHLNDQPLPNRMSSYQFGTPQKDILKSIQSMTLKNIPVIESLTHAHLVSAGGENLKQLESKKVFNAVKSTSHDKTLTSRARDKPENPLIFDSKTKNTHQKVSSIKVDKLKGVQSLAIDPLVLTSIAKHIPQLKTNLQQPGTDKVHKPDSMMSHLKQLQSTAKKLKLNSGKHDGSEHELTNDRLSKHNSDDFEEMSSVPDDVGESMRNDEIESASDDR